MSKRFTDVNKWRDPWFVDLPPLAKLFWIFLCDNCDTAGVWQVHVGLARAAIGADIDIGEMREHLGDRVAVLAGGKKWHLTKFVSFQYPRGLNPKVPAQLGVIRSLRSHGIPIPYVASFMGCQSHQDTDTETDKEQDQEQISNARATPAEIERCVVKPTPMARTVGDLRAIGAGVTRDDAEGWAALLRARSFEVIESAVQALRGRGAKPWLNVVIDEIDKTPGSSPTALRTAMFDGVRINLDTGEPVP